MPRQIAQAARAPTPGGPGVTGCVTFSQAGAELLFQVVGRAHEPHSFMVTTNLPLESRAEVLGSEPLTGALVDRPTHRVYIIEATYEGN